ncbi:AraC family transcriptional regulator [Paenibacillaceae bacterium]|nr:AraC family transcriptional regulator [Paenibacillaceae bacterium]
MNVVATVPLLTFLSPPLPYFIEADHKTYGPGDVHPGRINMGKFDLLFVREGRLTITEGDTTWVVQAGETLILRPDRRHYASEGCTEQTKFDWLHFQTIGEWEESGSSAARNLRGDHYIYAIQLPKSMKLSNPAEVADLFDVIYAAAGSSTQTAFWKRQQSFLQLLEMMNEEWRAANAPTALAVAERAAAYLKTNYREQVSNKSLGDELRLHPNYISRCMIEVYDATPQQYLMLYRMDQAKLLLIKTDWSVARIALETGFRQTPHFSRTFSEHAGLSPLQYRKQYTVDPL